MKIINKSDKIQRTRLNWIKRDLKPWEIADCTKEEFDYLMKCYSRIFWVWMKTKSKPKNKQKKINLKK